MNTFVPEGADYYAGAMALDTRRLSKQLVEVQQMHQALTTGGPAHILHHPATQMWLGRRAALLCYGTEVYSAYMTRTNKVHKSGEYICDEYANIRASAWPEVPDWVAHLALLHKTKLFHKDPVHYAQYAEYRNGCNIPRYPVTSEGVTVEWINYDSGRRGWFLDSDIVGAKYKTAWAAVRHCRAQA